MLFMEAPPDSMADDKELLIFPCTHFSDKAKWMLAGSAQVR